jgi:signal peptidase I
MSEPVGVRPKNLTQAKKKEEGGFGETVKVIIQALLIALVVRTLLFQPFNIPSGSMIPTLLIGDYLFVSKYSYGYSKHSIPFSPNLFEGRILGSPPKRGDVVVFKLPRDNSTDYIKRVIGLPGDRIQMIEGRLYINGQIVPREPINKVKTEDLYGRDVDVSTYKETLPGGVIHTIIEIQGDTGFNDNSPVFEVPRDHYFMMSRPNRAVSAMCRMKISSGGPRSPSSPSKMVSPPGPSGSGHGPFAGTGCFSRCVRRSDGQGGRA